jgi:hypothetical protein
MSQVYTAHIVSQTFSCNALSIEDAERKYDAYWDGEDCGCEEDNLECICQISDDVTHYWDGEVVG